MIKGILFRTVTLFGVLITSAPLRVHAEAEKKIVLENKGEIDDFEQVRLALKNYINAVTQHEGRSLIDIGVYDLSNYLGTERLLKIVKIEEGYKRLFGLHDRIRSQKLDISDSSLLHIGNVPRDVIFMATAGFLVEFKKIQEERHLNNVKISYEVVARGDEEQKVWEDLKYTASFYFYKSIESKWLLNSVIYTESESKKFWTLDGRISRMSAINFDSIARSWENALGR